MNMSIIKLFKEERFSIEEDQDTGKYYLAFPVFNGYFDDLEFYEILPDELGHFMRDEKALLAFVDNSRNRLNDGRLMIEPGKRRGYAC